MSLPSSIAPSGNTTPETRSPTKVFGGPFTQRDLSSGTHPISAFARVRPFSERQILIAEKEGTALRACLYGVHPRELVVDHRMVSATDKSVSRDIAFLFDEVMWSIPSGQREYLHPTSVSAGFPLQSASQEDVFAALGTPAVDATLRGINGCIIAFGQTESGKSHTVFGTAQEPGLAPRAAAKLFDDLERSKRRHGSGGGSSVSSDDALTPTMTSSTADSATTAQQPFRFTVAVGCFEIYNEKIIDLLAAHGGGAHQRSVHQRSGSNVELMQHHQQQLLGAYGSNAPSSCHTPDASLPANISASDLDDVLLLNTSYPDDVEFCIPRGSPTSVSTKPQTLLFCASGSQPTFALAAVSKSDDPPPGTTRFFALREQQLQQQRRTRSEDRSEERQYSNSSVSAIALMATLQESSTTAAPSGPQTTSAAAPGSTAASCPVSPAPAGLAATSHSTHLPGLRIRHDPTLGTYIEGLRTEMVDSEASATSLIQHAMKHRATSGTFYHGSSSRSHAILFFTVTQEDKLNGVRTLSTLHLVDLAGSERGAQHGAAGAKLEESKKINLSLTTLRRVIDLMMMESRRGTKASRISPQSIVSAAPPLNGATHLPVRDSKLTEVLSECFGGNSLTAMIATVSPHEHNILETLDSLRYATKAKAIVNRVKPNEERIAVAIHAVQHEIDRLQRELSAKNAPLLRLTAAHALAGKREKVERVLKRCNEDLAQRCNALRDDLDSLCATVAAMNRVAAAKEAEASVVRALSAEVVAVRSESSALGEALAREKRFSAASAMQLKDEEMEVLRLEKAPLPPSVSKLLRMKKRRWRRNFFFAVDEYRAQRALEEQIVRVESLRHVCRRLDDRASALDNDLNDSNEPDWVLYRKHGERLRQLAVAVGNAYEGLFHDCSALRADVAGTRSHIRNAAAEELSPACDALHSITAKAQECVNFYAALECALDDDVAQAQTQVAACSSDLERVTAEAKLIEAQLPHATGELQGLRNNEAQLSRRKQILLTHYASVSAEVRALEKEVAVLTSEVDATTAALSEVSDSLSSIDRDAELLVAQLIDAEHVTRQLSFPDAASKFDDASLASAALEVEHQAAMATPRRISGSFERLLRSRSQSTETRWRSDPRGGGNGAISGITSGGTAHATPLLWRSAHTPVLMKKIESSPTPPASPASLVVSAPPPLEDF